MLFDLRKGLHERLTCHTLNLIDGIEQGFFRFDKVVLLCDDEIVPLLDLVISLHCHRIDRTHGVQPFTQARYASAKLLFIFFRKFFAFFFRNLRDDFVHHHIKFNGKPLLDRIELQLAFVQFILKLHQQ